MDVAKKLTSDEIESEDGAIKASAVHKKDVLSVVTDTFNRFLEVLRTKQGTESLKNFETRFDALNATRSGSELPSALVSFIFLANSRIDTSQKVPILSAAAPIGSADANVSRQVPSMISYSSIASIVRACDEPKRPPLMIANLLCVLMWLIRNLIELKDRMRERVS